jgi:hypothetical protein
MLTLFSMPGLLQFWASLRYFWNSEAKNISRKKMGKIERFLKKKRMGIMKNLWAFRNCLWFFFRLLLRHGLASNSQKFDFFYKLGRAQMDETQRKN